MDDIEKSQIGKRREIAYEQINHSKIPKTNLPPMKAKLKEKDTFAFNFDWYSFFNTILLVILVIFVIAILLGFLKL